MRTIAEGLRALSAFLANAERPSPIKADIPDAAREASLILRHVLGWSAVRFSASLGDPVTEAAMDQAFDLAGIRRSGRPLSHVLGYRDFYNARFVVTNAVLDPRPDTELLVSLALSAPFKKLLDLGTGSGCIAISLLAERQDAMGVATDISSDALGVAGQNARALGVEDRLHFEHSDWFEAVGGTYDLIVSNPPYVSETDYAALNVEVHHEPKIAVTPGGDGLGPYRVIARAAPRHLTPGGRLLVEIGFDQGTAVAQLFVEAGLDDVAVHPDLNGKDRVVSARAARIDAF